MSKPNILYIFTDQQCADAMSCAGNPYVRTPAMDRLAANGVRFDNAYCSYPLCVPSRMSMVTGRMPHEMEIFANCHPTERICPFPTLGTLFREAGYRTRWIGKWHLTIPEERAEEHGFTRIRYGDGYGDTDARKTAETVDFLKECHEQPFFLVLSFNNPHDCCEWSRGDELKMGPLPDPPPPADLPPLPRNHCIPEGEPDMLRCFAREQQRTFRAMEWDEMQARRYLWGYYRLVEMVDREVGRVLDAVSEAGLEDDTLIVFSSDHGDGAARHRWNQKWSLYDESARVPLIVAGRGVGRAGEVDDRLVSAGLDLLPTLCDYGGITVPDGLQGRSLRALIDDDGAADWRDRVVSETTLSMWAEVGEDNWPKARMVRSDRYKYVAYDKGEIREQLLDMHGDSGETVNLAARPDHRRILARHRELLDDWCRKTSDAFRRDNPDA